MSAARGCSGCMCQIWHPVLVQVHGARKARRQRPECRLEGCFTVIDLLRRSIRLARLLLLLTAAAGSCCACHLAAVPVHTPVQASGRLACNRGCAAGP